MFKTCLSACGVAIATLTLAGAAQAKPPDVNSDKLERAVTVPGIVEHQRALQNIADMNGGTRHTETPGYTASVAYVRETMKRAGWNVSVSPVQHARVAGDRGAGVPAAHADGEDVRAGHGR